MAAWSDWKYYRIPNRLIIFGIVSGIMSLVFQAADLEAGSKIPWLLLALSGFLVRGVAVLVLGIFLHSLGMIGAADLKLVALLAAWLGFSETIKILCVGFILGAVWSLQKMLRYGSALGGEDMIKVMVVYDEDPLYAGRLAEYVNQKETFPFQAMAFSDLEKLKAYGRDHEIAILLVGERVREEAKEIKAGLKMLLCDGEFVSQEEASVYKFQSGDCILQEVMACYCTVPPEPGLALIGKRALIMGVYSPIGRCGKTSFSLTLAHMLGKSQGVLFISLEEYSGFSKVVCGGYEQDLSDVFYLYRQGDFNWLKLKSLILSHGNVDYIPPAAYGEDLDQAQPEEIAGLLKQIGTESGYERIVVDMGHMGKGALELFAACDVVYMPVLDDPVSTAKLEDFETYLKEAGHKGMEEKIQKLHLPEIKTALRRGG